MRAAIPTFAVVAATLAGPLSAQTSGRFLPLTDPATPFVEQLIRSGVMRDPDPLTRPLRRADVARALADVDTTPLARALRGMVGRLLEELTPPASDSARWLIDATAGALAASDARRDPVRPATDSAGLYPQGGMELALELPHLTLVTSPRFDDRLRYDPDYHGKKDRFVAGRASEAYLAASWRYFEVFFGTMDRNWGPAEADGLLLSDNPYNFDHLMLRFGPQRLRLELVATQLDPLPLWDTSQPVNRYLSIHRLEVQPSQRLAFSLTESAVYAQTGGIPRSFEPWYLNPLNLFLLSQADGATTSNALLAADVAWRPRGTLRLAAQGYLDDFQVDRRAPGDREPPGYGVTLNASGGLRGGLIGWSLLYTRVTNLAYRTPANEEQYSFRGVGLGRNYADYDQATARASAAAAPDLLLGAELTWLRQGQGDFRTRYPAVSLYGATPTIFEGVVERTVRVAATGSWTARPWLFVTADLGRHLVRNAGHVDGSQGDRWVWRVQVAARRRFGGRLSW